MENLTAAQEEAIFEVERPVLVIAGPGTGKTKILVEQAAYLISQKVVNPENILICTFTNKAAFNLKNKIKNKLGDNIENNIHISTIHSFCFDILKTQYTNKDLKVLTEIEQFV